MPTARYTMSPEEVEAWQEKLRQPATVTNKRRRSDYWNVIPRYCRRWCLDGYLPKGTMRQLERQFGIGQSTANYHMGYPYEFINAREWGWLVGDYWRRVLEAAQ